MTFTKEQLSELMCNHAERENGLYDLMEIMLESLMLENKPKKSKYHDKKKGRIAPARESTYLKLIFLTDSRKLQQSLSA